MPTKIFASSNRSFARHAFDRRSILKAGGAFAGVAAVQIAYPDQLAYAAFTNVDLRAEDVISDVKNQDKCNSCTAHAVVATMEGSYNKQRRQPGEPKALYSVAQLAFCPGAPQQCNTTHWWPIEALAYCKTIGLVSQAAFPYPSTLREYPDVNWCEISRPTSTTKVPKTPIQLSGKPDAIKTWIRTKGPVVAVMLEYEGFNVWEEGLARVYKPGRSTTANVAIVGGHVVSIIGYGVHNHTQDGQEEYWLCQNSWGTDWNKPTGGLAADYGYFKVLQDAGYARKDTKRCHIDSIDVWGIDMVI